MLLCCLQRDLVLVIPLAVDHDEISFPHLRVCDPFDAVRHSMRRFIGLLNRALIPLFYESFTGASGFLFGIHGHQVSSKFSERPDGCRKWFDSCGHW